MYHDLNNIAEDLNIRLQAELSLPLSMEDIKRVCNQMLDDGIEPNEIPSATISQITEAIGKCGIIWVNLTPYTINIRDRATKEILEYPASGIVAEVDIINTEYNEFNIRTQYYSRNIEGLPRRIPGIRYIVSTLIVAAISAERDDVVSPVTRGRDVERAQGGKIICCPGFWR